MVAEVFSVSAPSSAGLDTKALDDVAIHLGLTAQLLGQLGRWHGDQVGALGGKPLAGIAALEHGSFGFGQG